MAEIENELPPILSVGKAHRHEPCTDLTTTIRSLEGGATLPSQALPIDYEFPHLETANGMTLDEWSVPPRIIPLTPTTPDSAGPRKQRQRSGAVTTGTPMLSMGYRADCGKCRMKTPGHLNHILYR